MPYHRIPRNRAEELVPQIEANGEIIVAAWIEGDHYAVWTQPLGMVIDRGQGPVFRPVQTVDTGNAVYTANPIAMRDTSTSPAPEPVPAPAPTTGIILG